MNVLEEAMRIVDGPRQEKYGHPRDNYRRLATMWSALLDCKITPREAVMMMVLVKVAREANAASADNLVDIAGYARVAEMLDEGMPLDEDVRDERDRFVLKDDLKPSEPEGIERAVSALNEPKVKGGRK